MTDIMVGNAPESWPTKRLGQLFRERREKVSDKDFPALSVTKMGILPQLDNAAKSDDGDNRKGVRAGDFVINSRSDRKGSGGLSNLEGSVSLINIVLEPVAVEPRFAHHLLRSGAFQEEFYRWGHGIVADLWTTRYSDMKNIVLAVPNPRTQNAIADFLDRETALIDQLIEKKQRQITLSEEHFTAQAYSLVGGGNQALAIDPPGSAWQFLALGREITLQRGVDITKEEQTQTGEYPVVSSGGVSSFHDQFLCRGPGVLIGRKGSAGKLHYETRDYWPHDTTLYVKRFGANLPRFVFYKLMALDLASFDRSSANPTINRNLIHPVKVWWPNPTAQMKIVATLDALDQQKAQLAGAVLSSLRKLQEFRSALITAAVTGRIDVTTWGKQGQTDRRLDKIQEEMGA